MNEKTTYQNPTSEEWWASVLAEEGKYSGGGNADGGGTRPKVKPEARQLPPDAKKVDWTRAKALYDQDQILQVTVKGANRGGLLVEDETISGFVPFSHLMGALENAEGLPGEVNLEAYLEKPLRVKVIECVEEESRIVFSERAAQAESGRRMELFHSLEAGQCVQGVVTNLTDFGAFVDLGGVEGLIHISELSWGRVSHPSQVVKLNDQVTVKILDLSAARSRVALSLKQLQANPWKDAETAFPVGRILPATITSVLSFGAFARLDANVEGLIHASEIPQAEGKSVKDVLTLGARVDVRVLHVEPSQQRLGLSMRLEK
ncbi:MAG: 30S ribosomal protein S1 [Anaerolineales bacterium]|nr:30S ribosomal protein S1 [Anaerolineales bacterium]